MESAIPPATFLIDLLNYLCIGHSQLVPNSFIYINCFIAHFHKIHIQPYITLFSQWFSIGGSKLSYTKNFIFRHNVQSWKPTPISNKGWHNKWTFINSEHQDLPRWSSGDARSLNLPLPKDQRASLNLLLQNMSNPNWELSLLQNEDWLSSNRLKAKHPEPLNIPPLQQIPMIQEEVTDSEEDEDEEKPLIRRQRSRPTVQLSHLQYQEESEGPKPSSATYHSSNNPFENPSLPPIQPKTTKAPIQNPSRQILRNSSFGTCYSNVELTTPTLEAPSSFSVLLYFSKFIKLNTYIFRPSFFSSLLLSH